MSCVVFGPGLVGSYLGIAAGAAACVHHRGRLPAARRALLPAGESVWTPRVLTAIPEDAPVLVACRAHQTPWSRLPLGALAAQNGLGQPIAVATCFLALDLDEDGVIRHVGPPPRVVVGFPDPRWQPVLAAWRAAGIIVEDQTDPRPAQWEKAILTATVGPLCLATGLGMSAVWSDPDLRATVLAATQEGAIIAAANEVTVAPGLEHRARIFFASVGSHRPSVLKDAGELPWVLGHLIREAHRHDLAAPALGRIAAALVERPAKAGAE